MVEEVTVSMDNYGSILVLSIYEEQETWHTNSCYQLYSCGSSVFINNVVDPISFCSIILLEFSIVVIFSFKGSLLRKGTMPCLPVWPDRVSAISDILS